MEKKTKKKAAELSKPMQCAIKTAKWLGKHSLNGDVSIYVDGKRYAVDDEGNLVFDIEADPKKYFEWAGSFMSMSFEGPLYYVLNNCNDWNPEYDWKRQEELDKIFKEFGMYYELGNAWNLSLYDI